MRLTALLFALSMIVSCSHPEDPKSTIIEGLASVDAYGNIKLFDVDDRRWFSVYPSNAAKLPPSIARFRSTYKDRCWFRLFGVRVRGTTRENGKLNAYSVDIIKRYSDADVPALLERVRFEPLKGKHTCGSN